MKNRSMPRKFGRVATVTLGTVVLATLAAAPAQAATWTLNGPARESADYGSDKAAIDAAYGDIPGLERQCIRQDGRVEDSDVWTTTSGGVFWAKVACGSKRDVS